MDAAASGISGIHVIILVRHGQLFMPRVAQEEDREPALRAKSKGKESV
jgi:hypothetical protein